MSEQELRDYVKSWTFTFGTCVNVGKNAAYDAHVVALDNDTLAMRILRNGRGVSAWGIYTYARAVSVLAWAESGGNWKEEVSE
jgi:hypothetical protein